MPPTTDRSRRRRPASPGSQWMVSCSEPITGPMLLHAANPARRGLAVCGRELLAEELWCRADGWMIHARNHARLDREPAPCGCIELCGPCLYLAGWPAGLAAA